MGRRKRELRRTHEVTRRVKMMIWFLNEMARLRGDGRRLRVVATIYRELAGRFLANEANTNTMLPKASRQPFFFDDVMRRVVVAPVNNVFNTGCPLGDLLMLGLFKAVRTEFDNVAALVLNFNGGIWTVAAARGGSDSPRDLFRELGREVIDRGAPRHVTVNGLLVDDGGNLDWLLTDEGVRSRLA